MMASVRWTEVTAAPDYHQLYQIKAANYIEDGGRGHAQSVIFTFIS